MTALLLLTLVARADVILPPAEGSRYVTHALRVQGLEAHPDVVLLAYEGGAQIRTWRVFSADGESQWDLGSGRGRSGAGMSRPSVHLLPKATFDTWSAAASAEIARQRTACDERGEGCVHISRFTPRIAPPAGAVSCGLTLDLVLVGPKDGPDQVVDIAELVAADATTCTLELTGREATLDGKPVTGGQCSTTGGVASALAGLGLLLGLGRRRRPAALPRG